MIIFGNIVSIFQKENLFIQKKYFLSTSYKLVNFSIFKKTN